MKNLTGNQIRQLFIDFFKKNGHREVPAVPLIPKNDPTLLWINSGVAGLKQYFDGTLAPISSSLVNCQRSLRTNDIENVGVTSRHHTFFEMLGNFSIGGYFRDEALAYAFEFLTSSNYLDFSTKDLYVTYYPGDLGTKQIWIKLGMPEDHIIPCLGNFWEIGEGPCGPSSEIFFDRGPKYDSRDLGTKMIEEEIENNRYVEIWNIVFSQFSAKNGLPREQYPLLPKKNIDTGSGLERLTAIVQGKDTNFETDLFMPLIHEIEKKCGIKYQDNKKAFFIIADHVRALTFTLSDGAVFSSNERGYVLRRLLRRASRYLMQLGINEPYLYQLVSVVVNEMKGFYHHLPEAQQRVTEMIKSEEVNFQKTLRRGFDLFNSLVAKGHLTGAEAFKLYDTYGFPIELTLELAQELKIDVDLKEYNHLMQLQKEKASSSRAKEESMHQQDEELLSITSKSQFIDDKYRLTTRVDKVIRKGEDLLVVFKETCFFATSGGQICDLGKVYNNSFNAEVHSVFKAPHGQHVHVLKTYEGFIAVGEEVVVEIDATLRQLVSRNHSATHLLQYALRQIFPDLHQAGSEVDQHRLRFDFACHRKVSAEELQQVEQVVNQLIASGANTKITTCSYKEAIDAGAISIPGEKYPDQVRLVALGNVSKELCGGTHVSNISEIGLFHIVSESSIAAGTRRIEAKTSLGAYQYLSKRALVLDKVVEELKSAGDDVVLNDVTALQKAYKSSCKELADLQKSQLINVVKSAPLVADNPPTVLIEENNYQLNIVADVIKNNLVSNRLYIVYSLSGNILVIVGRDVKNVSAADILKNLNIKGGGHALQAQGKGDLSHSMLMEYINAHYRH